MPQRATLVRIPQPCHERWDAMMPTAAGRHCAACRKTVVDFTQKTDAEILAALRQAAGETCGRLRADQLSRPLVVPAPAPRWRAWLGAVLAAGSVLGAGRAAAQARNSYYAGPQPLPAASPASNAIATEPSRAAAPPATETAPGKAVTVRGVVQDAATHEGVPGATVLVKGTTTGASTDANGAFELTVAASGAPAVLTFSSVGYVGQESLLAPGSSQPLAIALATDVNGLMGEVIVIGGVSQRPWPWHPRRFFNWGKYWVTKPFRAG
ncbi:carboxypeptidase-like regulatory domain-containing protein [Hymenobacter cheonanensis]|uniref:carboxypeptidase-like regulatory domain-containing protein n=1 Tax=Hymenobacter sp. CA2-7 TaxID=3063993 RepID=UPI0027126806|nr:carboxypeptidase-like regulatory domain-containing protein [Hymenobacter sp. CA2-7]MDO7884677.1 carboxypeptidase-like regulatory domain-containing protein [Hymenobacter sp. CA2-7]